MEMRLQWTASGYLGKSLPLKTWGGWGELLFYFFFEGRRWCVLENMVLVKLELYCRTVSLGKTEPHLGRSFTSHYIIRLMAGWVPEQVSSVPCMITLTVAWGMNFRVRRSLGFPISPLRRSFLYKTWTCTRHQPCGGWPALLKHLLYIRVVRVFASY